MDQVFTECVVLLADEAQLLIGEVHQVSRSHSLLVSVLVDQAQDPHFQLREQLLAHFEHLGPLDFLSLFDQLYLHQVFQLT